jgi:PAS domain S-box-containing protein
LPSIVSSNLEADPLFDDELYHRRRAPGSGSPVAARTGPWCNGPVLQPPDDQPFRRLFDATPLGILVYELRAGRLVLVDRNPAADRILGVDTSRLLGLPIEDAFPPLAVTELPQRYREVAEHGRSWHSEQVDYAHGGIRGAFDVTAFQVAPGTVAVLFSDISERRRAERELQERAEQLRFLSENLAQGMVYQIDSGRDGKSRGFVYLSPAVERLHGLTVAQVTADPALLYSQVVETVPGQVAEREARAFAARARLDLEVQVRLPSGELRWRHFISTPRELPDGRVIWDGIELDITEQKRAAEEREALQAQLAQAQKMELVGRLAGGVAHDINNILQVILGIAGLAREGNRTVVDLVRDMDEIAASAWRAADLSRQLLAFARRQPAQPRVLDLNARVVELLRLLQRSVGENIELRWLPGPGLWPVRVDPSQLDQILVNLCVNARDAIAGTGRITIETANEEVDEFACAGCPGLVPGPYTTLAVQDDGQGMAPDVLARVFEPFFTTKVMGRGAGLGLATVYGIVKQNGGWIGATSEPGRGSTFRIYLPRASRAETAHAAGAAPETPRGRGQTVLVVEDDPAVLRLTARMIEGLGYRVLAAAGLADALQRLAEHAGPVDLLVTDVVMPAANGREVAERLRTLQPDLPCLFVSGYDADVVSRHGLVEQGIHLLQKPFSTHELAVQLERLLQNRT